MGLIAQMLARMARFRRDQAGVTAVTFALLALLLICVTFAAIDASRAFSDAFSGEPGAYDLMGSLTAGRTLRIPEKWADMSASCGCRGRASLGARVDGHLVDCSPSAHSPYARRRQTLASLAPVARAWPISAT